MPLADEGLEHLAGFKALRELHLCNARTTQAAVRDLSRRLPDLQITE